MNHTGNAVNTNLKYEGFSLFQHLPDELKYYVFSHFDHITLVCAAPVCPEWRALADTDKFWMELYHTTWHGDDTTSPRSTKKEEFIRKYQLWKLYKPYADTGEFELSWTFLEDISDSIKWPKVYLPMALYAGGMQVWQRGLPEFNGDDTNAPKPHEMRIALRAERRVALPLNTVIKLLENPKYRLLWDENLVDGMTLVHIDKRTDIVLLIYDSVDCCLIRRKIYSHSGDKRKYILSEQAVPYSVYLEEKSQFATKDRLPYKVEEDTLVNVWGSGFLVEELAPELCQVCYIVQVIPDESQRIHADGILNQLVSHRILCLHNLEYAASQVSDK